jgi:serine-type D-Ala-D-Ala carboxypeptidase/endopeptidase (penicillin-binding protein 4)
MKYRSFFVILAYVLCVNVSLVSASIRFAPDPIKKPVSSNAVELASAKVFVSSSDLLQKTGFILIDRATGEVLDSHNPNDTFIPASVSKIFTAQYVLDTFGESYTFETRLLKNSTVENGVLKGDLILKGGGDPELNVSHLVDFIKSLKQAGIHTVEGHFLYDPSALPSLSQLEEDQPVTAAYNPSVSGLNLNFNRIKFSWKQDKSSRYDLAVTSQSDEYEYPIDYASVGVADGDVDVRHSVGDQGESWVFSPETLKSAGTLWLPVRNSASYTANVFYWIAQQEGITLPKPRLGTTPVFGDTINVHTSRPVKEILEDMLLYSTNVTAEALGASASIARGERVDTLLQSARSMTSVLMPDVSRVDLNLVNHSGLSSWSRATPIVTATMLKNFDLSGILPPFDVNEIPDTVSITAKTGTIYFGRGLAGYITAPNNHQLAFAIYTSDYDKRSLFEKDFNPNVITSELMEEREWLRRARDLENDILSFWVQHFVKAQD